MPEAIAAQMEVGQNQDVAFATAFTLEETDAMLRVAGYPPRLEVKGPSGSAAAACPAALG